MKNLFFIIVLQLVSINILSQENLSPYYIFPREDDQHIDLSNNMLLTYSKKAINVATELDKNEWFTVNKPTSIQWANFLAGKFPDPYKHLNLKDYKELEDYVWYYKKEFEMPSIP